MDRFGDGIYTFATIGTDFWHCYDIRIWSHPDQFGLELLIRFAEQFADLKFFRFVVVSILASFSVFLGLDKGIKTVIGAQYYFGSDITPLRLLRQFNHLIFYRPLSRIFK